MIIYILLGVFSVAFIVVARHGIYPKPYPGIPYNKESANRLTGDIPDLVPIIQAQNEFTNAVFTITTQKLGQPIAQLLFPAVRTPLIILEDPRAIEDIVLRRNKEFDKAPMAIDTLSPMFPHATTTQYTTPELRAQKRLWVDVMSSEFLHKVAAPNIHKATLELLDLWRLKGSTLYKNQPFATIEDFQNAALDAIWVAIVGDEPGMTRYELTKLKCQIVGNSDYRNEPLPSGAFLKEEVDYIGRTVARNANTPVPKWTQMMEMLTPRYRKFRRTISREIGRVMEKSVNRFQRLELGQLEAEEFDTCMMDLVLRRQVLEAKKARRPLTDPTKDQSMLDEMFMMLVAGYDSTTNALAWFVRYMESYPTTQDRLRKALKDQFPNNTTPSVQEILKADIPYLDAACEEGFRLAGVAKGNLRQACVDTEILGCRIPKGAQILMNFHVNHTPAPVDESRYAAGTKAAVAKHGDGLRSSAGKNLGAFEPARWLVKDEKTGKEVFNPHALPSLAFGGGYRGCAGRKLATMEFRIVVTLLILDLEFLELPPQFKSLKASEQVFRAPDMPYVRLREL